MAERAPQSTEALYADSEPQPVQTDHAAEEMKARRLASRYQLEFVDLEQFHIDHALFRSIPADLMLRYGFVPYRRDGQTLLIVVSDPSDLQTIDEVGVQLGTPIRVCVGTAFVDSEHPQEERELDSACSRKRPKASRFRSCARTKRAKRTSRSRS